MGAALSDRPKWGDPSFPRYADSAEQLGHRRIVRYEQFVAVECKRKMKIADFEGDTNRLLPITGVNHEKRFTGSLHRQIPVRSYP